MAEPAKTKNLTLLLLGVFAVSTGAIFIKLCSLEPFTVGAYRMTLGLPIFWYLAWRAKPVWWKALETKELALMGFSGVFLGLHFATWIASLEFTTVASSVVLVTTNPIFVGIGSVLFLGDRPSKTLWLGTIVAFLGTVLVAYGTNTEGHLAPQPWLGNTLALSGAIFMSAYLLAGRKLSSRLPTVCYVASVYSVAAITLWIGVLATGSSGFGFAARDWLLLLLLAGVPQGIGHTLLNRSLKVLSPSIVALMILAEPVFASLLAIPILNEWPSLLQVLGAGAVVAGVGASVMSEAS